MDDFVSVLRPKKKIVVLPLNGKIRNFGRSVFFFKFFLNSGIISMATYIAPILTILRNL